MKLNKIAAAAAMAGAIGSAALGIGAGMAQADPHGLNPPVPGCTGGPGVNCNGPGTPLPPGQGGIAPPPGHYNDPSGYGLPPNWMPPGSPIAYPVVFNPAVNAWGVFLPDGQFVTYVT